MQSRLCGELVCGFSAGGFGTSLVAENVFDEYYLNVENKAVLVDSSLLLFNDWQEVSRNIWHSPEEITKRLVSNNITLDGLTSLHQTHPDVKIMFDCSIHDMALIQYQSYLDTGKDFKVE